MDSTVGRCKQKMRVICGEDGFTLVEMLAVILIIGILVSIATLSFIFSVTQAKETACKADLKTLKGALDTYLATYNFYPSNLKDLYPDFIHNSNEFLCPVTRNTYIYMTNADRTSYTITCPDCGD
jgi:prepilin-type N-terminal cleavage/methylation domain-containing protein